MADSGYGVINEQGILFGETPVLEFEEKKDKEKSNNENTNRSKSN